PRPPLLPYPSLFRSSTRSGGGPMVIRLSLGLVVALVLALLAPADAQQPTADTKAAKGVKARNLVTSLGGFSATVNATILLTGQTDRKSTRLNSSHVS